MKKQSFLSRDLSWLSFNARILQEANDHSVPLKERIRFLGIHSNNLDEFFRVRIATLKKMVELKNKSIKTYLNENPQDILNQIQVTILKQKNEFDRIWRNILKELKKEKIFLVNEKQLNANQKLFIKNFFEEEVSPNIVPLFIQSLSHLPHLWDKSIFLGVVMYKKYNAYDKKYAIIEIPTGHMSRFVPLPSTQNEQQFILLEDVIRFNLPYIFSYFHYNTFDAHMFKIIKDSEIDIDNDLSETLVEKIQRGVKNRRKARAVGFTYDKNLNPELLKYLMHKLNISHHDNIISGGRIRNFRDFINFPALLPNNKTHHSPFIHPTLIKTLRVSDIILKQDVMLHFPYHSFKSVIDLLREAAMDPDVQSIKITAYRLATNSKICNALINAVRNGKKVIVILELRARFDEEANLEWKTKLEEEGVKVFCGLPQIKVHAKLCVIQKKLGKHAIQYGFISTGNFNEKTALTYIDHCLLTSNKNIMNDINQIFKHLENLETPLSCKTLLITPSNMREIFLEKISREIKFAKMGKPAKIIINLNNLNDETLIKKIYHAAKAGVEVKMIIRGIFHALINDQKFKKPIQAISIVDEYLEHSRIIMFNNNGKEKIYISSADWMSRNLDRRLEVAVPILSRTIQTELKHVLNIKLSDNIKARRLNSSLSNEYVLSEGEKKVRSQLAIYRYLQRKKYKK